MHVPVPPVAHIIITKRWEQTQIRRIAQGKFVMLPLILPKGTPQICYDRVNTIWRWLNEHGWVAGCGALYDRNAAFIRYCPPHKGTWV